MKKIVNLLSLVLIAVALVACSSGTTDGKSINLSYVEWDSEVASTHVIAQVLEDQGYDVTLTPLDNAIMWESVANSETDGMVAAWLPGTHKAQYEKYQDKIEDLGVNLTGAKVGLVVPAYMDVDSIEDLSDEAKKEITAIEPGSGVVQATEKALKEYDNLKDWKINYSSSGAMAISLEQAINNNEEIIVTGWSPHWKFAKFELKYLEDSKKIFGEEETINTMVRLGLKDDDPVAYNILDKFNWEASDMEEVMSAINDGASPKDAAKEWVENNQDKVNEWIK